MGGRRQNGSTIPSLTFERGKDLGRVGGLGKKKKTYWRENGEEHSTAC